MDLLCRAIPSDRDKLCLAESHFYNFHLLSPYYVELVLDRLSNAYCCPLEMENDVAFFIKCTVHTYVFCDVLHVSAVYKLMYVFAGI